MAPDQCRTDDQMQFFHDPFSRFIWQHFFPVQFVLGVLGNSLNLWVLTSEDLSNIANDLLAAVSLCDLSFLIAMLPHALSSYDYFSLSYNFRFFYLPTKLHLGAFANWMSAAAIWLILAVSIERLLVVKHPLRSKMYWGGAKRAVIIGAIFVATGLLTFYHHVEYNCVIIESCNGTQIYDICLAVSRADPKQAHLVLPAVQFYTRLSAYCNAALVVFVPILLVIVLNIVMLRTLRVNAFYFTASEPSTYERTRRTTQRVTATVIAIALCFSITQGPSAIMTLAELFYDFNVASSFYDFYKITNSLVVTGKTTNFILFCLSSRHFRMKCGNLIFKKFPRLSESHLLKRTLPLCPQPSPAYV